MTELADTQFRHNEQDNVRVPKLNRLLQHLIDAEEITLDDTIIALAGLSSTSGVIEQTAPDVFGIRLVGVANATDLLTRAGGDGRYAAIGSGVLSFNTRTGAVTLTSGDVTGALTYTPTSVTGLTGTQSVAAFKTGLALNNVDNTSNATERAAVATLTNKTITLAANTVTGTKLQFNTAVTDGDFFWAGDTLAIGSITGFGTGVAAALAIAVGSAGAPVLFNGAGGTPSSLTLTNATGLPTAGHVNDSVTYAKMQNVSAASRVLGRGSASGAGDPEELSVGLGLEVSGTTIQRASGTAFPGAPASGDIFFRTDRDIEYRYDGTRWLSTNLLALNFSPTDFQLPITGTKNSGFRTANPWFSKYDFYMVDAIFARFPLSVAASTWTFTIVKSNPSASATIVSQAAATDTNNVWNATRTAVNAVVTNDYISFDGTATLNSGSVTTGEYVLFSFTYRLIG